MSSGPNTLLLMLRLLVSLGVVLAVVGAAVWALKRRGSLGGATAGTSDRLEVLDRRALSKHAAVAVVRTGGHTYLVGVTDQQVSVLGDWDAPAAPDTAVSATVDLRPASPAPQLVRRDTTAPAAPLAALGTGTGRSLRLMTTTGTRWTGSPRPIDPDGNGQETRMGFVEALRELTVRRS
jgi:flagellar biosynthetic protein FliO